MRVAIGDVHGRDFWKHYVKEDFTEFYVTGDYFDSFDLPFVRQYRNFRELCEWARSDRRIKLCLGNHDYHYLGKIPRQQYSGYQSKYDYEIYQVLEQNIDLLKIVYVTEDNCIISHAGVSAWFMNQMKAAGYSAVEDINTAFAEDRAVITFNGNNPFGDDITQSPIWIRPHSLEKEPVSGYNQIVGHTPIDAIRTVSLPDKKRGAVTITYIDTDNTESIYRF
ncbi:MAG: metallophosphoesterase [Spirochaetaceae bacterium]|nr:metallophosphoesterase [Spirochaetaceae bacterium]